MIDETIKNMRIKSGMTVKKISDKSNVPTSTVSRFFASPDTSPYQTVQAIVEAMGYTMADLCDGEAGGKIAAFEERQRRQEAYNAAMADARGKLLAEKDTRIRQLGKWLRWSVIYSVSITGILVGLFLYDALNPTVGWFQRQLASIHGDLAAWRL